jgi:ABC-2 type transport system ATP-binding protein
LLQAIAGSMYLSEGTLEYRTVEQLTNTQQETRNQQSALIPPEKIYRQISIAAPYLELVEEMTAREFLHFHQQFKPFIPGIETEKILSLTGLETAADKQIRYFSSGMKQRIKLAQAVFSDTPVLLLDEPCTNLDSSGYELYHFLISNYCTNKLVIVSSNDAQEMDFCRERIQITDYK